MPTMPARYYEDRYPIGRLVFCRANALLLTRRGLAERLGFRDLTKGHDSGKLVLRGTRVGEQIAEHALVIILVGKAQQVVADVGVVTANVFFMLGGERFAGFQDLVSMVEELHGLFQCHGYQQPNDDGGNMKAEAFPGINRFVRCVNVEHRR